MESNNIIDLIQYDEAQPDVEAIMQQIRQYLAEKHGTRLPVAMAPSESRLFDGEVYEELFEANQVYDKTFVTPYLTTVRIPLLGALWQRLRAQFHSLVIYYVNRAADAQVRYNAHVARILNGVVHGVDRDPMPERIEVLTQRVAELQRRLQALEARVGTSTPETPKG